MFATRKLRFRSDILLQPSCIGSQVPIQLSANRRQKNRNVSRGWLFMN